MLNSSAVRMLVLLNHSSPCSKSWMKHSSKGNILRGQMRVPTPWTTYVGTPNFRGPSTHSGNRPFEKETTTWHYQNSDSSSELHRRLWVSDFLFACVACNLFFFNPHSGEEERREEKGERGWKACFILVFLCDFIVHKLMFCVRQFFPSTLGIILEIMVQSSTRICVAWIFTSLGIVKVMAAISFTQNPNDSPLENIFDSTLLPGTSGMESERTIFCTATDFELESDLFGANDLDQSSFQSANGNLFSDEPLDPATLSTGIVLGALFIKLFPDKVRNRQNHPSKFWSKSICR